MSTTPWTGIFKVDNVVLRHYALPHDIVPAVLPYPNNNNKNQNNKNKNKPIVLILFGLINYPDILDLYPDRSIIRQLLEKSMDVYLLDWGEPPNFMERQLVFQDYVAYLLKAVAYLNTPDIYILGVCQGGIISLLFAALYPNQYKKLILFLSPVDFSYQNEFIRSFSCINTNQMVRNFGNIPGELMAKFLALFSPYAAEFRTKKNPKNPNNNKNSFYQALADWAYRSPAQAGFAFQEFIHDYIHENKLIKSELRVLGKRQINPIFPI